MLKILLMILAVVAAAVVAVLAVAARKPDTFRVSRSIVIEAPPEKIFPKIDNYAAWRAWSPYEDKDPALQRTYSGPQAGVGAHYAWAGDPKKVGSGSMTIVESTPPSNVKMKLDFLVPFEGHNTAQFSLEPVGQGATRLTWAMYGPSPFLSKLMGMGLQHGQDDRRGLRGGAAAAEDPSRILTLPASEQPKG